MKVIALGLLLSVAAFAHSVTLNWNWIQGSGPTATGFHVYRATTPTGTFTVVGSTAVTILTYIDSSTAVQAEGASFYYYVTAYTPTEETNGSNTVVATIPFALSPPGGLSATVK